MAFFLEKIKIHDIFFFFFLMRNIFCRHYYIFYIVVNLYIIFYLYQKIIGLDLRLIVIIDLKHICLIFLIADCGYIKYKFMYQKKKKKIRD